MGGLRYLTGYKDRPPVRSGLSIGDTLAGLNGAVGALLRRHCTGTERAVVKWLDLFHTRGGTGVTESLVSEYDGAGHIRERSGPLLLGIAPSNAYPTADGDTVIIGANQDSVFARLTEVAGSTGSFLRRAVSQPSRTRRESRVLDLIISDRTRIRDRPRRWCKSSRRRRPAGLTYRAKEMLCGSALRRSRAIVRVEDARLGHIAMQNVFPRLSESPGRVIHTGPELARTPMKYSKNGSATTRNGSNSFDKDSIV